MADIDPIDSFKRSSDKALTTPMFDNTRKKVNKLLKQDLGRHFVEFTDIKFPRDYDDGDVHLRNTTRVRQSAHSHNWDP